MPVDVYARVCREPDGTAFAGALPCSGLRIDLIVYKPITRSACGAFLGRCFSAPVACQGFQKGGVSEHRLIARLQKGRGTGAEGMCSDMRWISACLADQSLQPRIAT